MPRRPRRPASASGGSWSSWSDFTRVTVAEQRARAAAAAARLGKGGRPLAPVRIEGREISTTFWGRAWCQNLESYADFAHRLERGRSYLRAGAVVDLQIEPGRIEARVSGSSLYQIEVSMRPLAAEAWTRLARTAAGRIGSLVALLAGQLPDEVMRAVTDRQDGLFPKPRELSLSCTCPDVAEVCKHVAAVLYGVGARLDSAPELLFRLRGVDPKDLVDRATAGLSALTTTGAATLAGDAAELGALFGIELAPEVSTPAAPEPPATKAKAKARAKASAGGKEPAGKGRSKAGRAGKKAPVGKSRRAPAS